MQLAFQKFFRGLYPNPPGRERRVERRRIGKGRERKRGRGKKEKRRETRGKEWEVSVLPTLSIPEIRRPCTFAQLMARKLSFLLLGQRFLAVIL